MAPDLDGRPLESQVETAPPPPLGLGSHPADSDELHVKVYHETFPLPVTPCLTRSHWLAPGAPVIYILERTLQAEGAYCLHHADSVIRLLFPMLLFDDLNGMLACRPLTPVSCFFEFLSALYWYDFFRQAHHHLLDLYKTSGDQRSGCS